jgi:hypothetical protein
LLGASSPNAIQIQTNHKSIPVSYGEEVVVGDDSVKQWMVKDTVDRRRVRLLALPENTYIAKSEASPFSIFNSSSMLCSIYDSKETMDKTIVEKIVKMAACLTVVTAKNGSYTRMGEE